MSREEKILKIGSRIITVIASFIAFTPIFLYLKHHSDISTGITVLLMMAGVLASLLLNYLLGSIWYITFFIVEFLFKSDDDDDDYFNF